MRVVLAGIAGALAAGLMSLAAYAADPPKPENLRSEMMFQRMDTNHDGKISADEIPESAPEGVKEMLKKADKNGDKAVTKDELAELRKEFVSRMGPPMAGPGRPGGPPSRDGRPPRPEGGPGRPQGPEARWPSMGSMAGDGPRLPDPEQLFERLDRNRDKSLSVEEFTEGLKRMHAGWDPTAGFRGPGAGPMGTPGAFGPWRGRSPMAAPRFGMGPRGPWGWHPGPGMARQWQAMKAWRGRQPEARSLAGKHRVEAKSRLERAKKTMEARKKAAEKHKKPQSEKREEKK